MCANSPSVSLDISLLAKLYGEHKQFLIRSEIKKMEGFLYFHFLRQPKPMKTLSIWLKLHLDGYFLSSFCQKKNGFFAHITFSLFWGA